MVMRRCVQSQQTSSFRSDRFRGAARRIIDLSTLVMRRHLRRQTDRKPRHEHRSLRFTAAHSSRTPPGSSWHSRGSLLLGPLAGYLRTTVTCTTASAALDACAAAAAAALVPPSSDDDGASSSTGSSTRPGGNVRPPMRWPPTLRRRCLAAWRGRGSRSATRPIPAAPWRRTAARPAAVRGTA